MLGRIAFGTAFTVLFATLGACSGGAATVVSVRLMERPPALTVGQAWTARLRVLGHGAPRLRGTLGTRSIRFAVTRAGRGLFRSRVTFPAAGSWRLTAQLAKRSFRLGVVQVSPGLRFEEPAQVLVNPDGTLLVAERGSRDRIVRVDPATGTVQPFATGLSDPWGLTRAPDGSVFVSSGGSILRLSATGSERTKVADVQASPLVAAPAGELYYGNETEVGRIDASGNRHPYSASVSTVHGLALTGDGRLIISDSGNQRILSLDVATGAVQTIVTGLRDNLGIALEQSGSILVAEYSAGVLTRIRPDGARETAASAFIKPYTLAVAPDGTIYVVQAGEFRTVTGTLRRVSPDGRVSDVP